MGRLYPISHKDSPIFPSTNAPSHLLSHFRHVKNPAARFDWEAERDRHWTIMAPIVRAKHTWPNPGEPRTTDESLWRESFGADEEGAEKAQKNFSLVVMDVEEVDIVVQSPKMFYRRRWSKESGEWKCIELNP